jgi:histidine triad (HIT) family protein
MQKSNDDCIFCKIAAGKIPSKKVYEDADTYVFYDIHPIKEGHILVIPKQHVVNVRDCPPDLLVKIFNTIKHVTKDMKAFKIIQNNDKPIQEVFHLHFHIIPY